ncbi:hypothetical protein FHR70_000708 [Microvirga lupini]|uniref:DUF2591 domain-containing protein n=1 Tax=Microvirga lupini TaxID=420324 RepID=A0A7W4VI76_9HYPH|nr:phage protein NinX family protein [Microvirga lupini]MBB3017668.1 hypothetical protein [Microvirga lupini]
MTRMIEVKVAELSGRALDWAVDAVVSGRPLEVRHHKSGNGEWAFFHEDIPYQQGPAPYSTDWAKGGPLIQKYRISVTGPGHSLGFWSAHMLGSEVMSSCQGLNALQAACRRLVYERLGDTVSVPAELVGGGV